MPNPSPRITGLIDSSLKDWRAQVYGLVNPTTTVTYVVVPIGNSFYITKAISSGNDSNTVFIGPYGSSGVAATQMGRIKNLDGF